MLIAGICGVVVVLVLFRLAKDDSRLDAREIRRLSRLGEEMHRRSGFPID